MKRALPSQVTVALDRGAARAETYAGPAASALCMLAQRRRAGAMRDRRNKRVSRGSALRRAVNEG